MTELSDTDRLLILDLLPICTQCGQTFRELACGPSHALITQLPHMHRVLHPMVEARVTAAVADFRERLVRRMLNTVDPLLPGNEARMGCVQVARDMPLGEEGL